jgi:hypothetical protein
MINFAEGKISLGDKGVSAAANHEELEFLSEQGLLEKRQDAGDMYYYAEAERDKMRFGVFISLIESRIEWILLRWLDRPMKSWDDISEKTLQDEYRLISSFVEKRIGRSPDSKKNRQRTWRLPFAQVGVAYEPRSFDVAIFLVPR